MTAARQLRDQLRDFLPWWLSDRHYSNGKTVAFRYLWTMVAVLDTYVEVAASGLQAAWPGRGTPTALPYIGRTRGILRGLADTDDEYAAKLRMWLEKWARAGSQEQLAIELHEYLANHPRVRIVNRAGHWVTVNEDGSIETAQATFDWDSISNPERAGFWSEMWIIIYPQGYANRSGTLGDLTGDDGYGLGLMIPQQHTDAVKTLLSTWKSEHSKVRAVIWTSDGAIFDPTSTTSLPDGQWGMWSMNVGGHQVLSHRNTATCRYLEPQ